MIRARFSSLTGEDRRLLELASVVGRSFDLGLLCRATGHDEAGISGIVEPMISSEMIFETREGRYYFSHDKLRQALYEDMRTSRRRALHLQVAGVLESEAGEPAELAYHYLRAREWRTALKHLMQAARKAEAGHAWESALNDYDQALEVVEKLPGFEEAKFDLLASRESLLEHLDRREERAATVRDMFELAQRLGERTRIAEVHIRLIGVLMVTDPDEAAASGQAAVDIFRELDDAAGEARAHRELGYARWINHDYAGALETNLQALWIHRSLGYREAQAGDASNIAQVYRGTGDYDNALRWAEEAVHIAHELGDVLSESFKTNTVATSTASEETSRPRSRSISRALQGAPN